MAKKPYLSIIEQLQEEYKESYNIASFKDDKVNFGFTKLQLEQFTLPVGGRTKQKPDLDQDEKFDDANAQLSVRPSSTIQSAAYFTKKQYLVVSFKSGHTYSYSDVPVDVVRRWEKASSAGSFFYYNIRTAFNYQKMG